MNRGYIKVWRKIIDAGWLKNHKLCAFWLWCLMEATHREYDQIVGCQNIHLMPGEFIFGRKVASDELNMSERSIRTLLDFLRKSGNVTIKTTNKFSIVTIVNWNTYQKEENTNDQQNDQPLTSNRPTTDHKQEYKNIRTKEKKIYIPLPFENIKLTQTEYDTSIVNLVSQQSKKHSSSILIIKLKRTTNQIVTI